jgi:CBS domain-containing protein
MNLADIMTRELITVTETISGSEAVARLRVAGLHVLPVVDPHQRLVGLVLERDLHDAAWKHAEPFEKAQELPRSLLAQFTLRDVPVGRLMTSPKATLSADAPLEQAALKMLEYGVYGLPITNQEGRLEGVVTIQDLLGAFVLERKARAVV